MKDKILVLGASGLIGRYVYDELKDRGKEVIGTYHSNKKEGLIKFDIAFDDISEIDLNDVKYGIICSGIAKIELADNEYGRKVNYYGIEKVIDKFFENNIIPVYVSGAVVFDGYGNENEFNLRFPLNPYGLQKRSVENILISSQKDFLIIRSGKIYGVNENEGIFSDWIKKYRNNEEILCASDEILSLTYAKDFAKGINLLIDMKKTDKYHIDSGIHKSRLDFAREFFNYLAIHDAKIKECKIQDLNFKENRSKNTFLNSDKFLTQTGFIFAKIEDSYYQLRKLLI